MTAAFCRPKALSTACRVAVVVSSASATPTLTSVPICSLMQAIALAAVPLPRAYSSKASTEPLTPSTTKEAAEPFLGLGG